MTLEEYLSEEGIPLETTKLHVIREPHASMFWKRSEEDESITLEQLCLQDTAKNKFSHWKKCSHIVVLIDSSVSSSPLSHIEKSYFFIGVINVIGRFEGFQDEEGGTSENPAWNLQWASLNKSLLFQNMNLSRGYHFNAVSGTTASADQFDLIGDVHTYVYGMVVVRREQYQGVGRNLNMPQSNLPPIPLLPPEQQINAIYRLPDANFLNEMISCHTEGCTIQELVDTIKANGAYTQEYLGSLPRQLNRGYDFFGLDGDLVYANEVSQAYAEGNPEPMMLAAFRNFFLLAETLEWLNRHPESSPTQIRDAINTHYPNWNNDKQPADRVWWLRFFGLASPVANEKLIGKVVSITDKGRQVLARMDFTDRTLIGDATEEDIDNSLPSVAYSDILKEFEDQTELILNHKQLKGIHNGLHANPEKRFIILSGLSGTGKTKMLQEYAEAYCRLLNLDSSELVKLVSITPAFRDHTHLLGYLNPLTKPPSYVMGELTQFLLNALENPQYPFFLILDEMNLARVEFYLAPILSAMESRTAIALHDSTEINSPPNALRCWPSNVFLAGTVNMDETTHAFSDKVLDRAFTMEFWDIDLKEYFKRNSADSVVQSTITSLYDALKPAHLHFGYRTVKAIVDYVTTAIETDPDDKMDALDQAVFSKVLPKLRGQQSTELVDALNAVFITCEHLALSKAKIESMLHRLNETGLTRFWR